MTASWLSFWLFFGAVSMLFVLHAFIVMCEISLVKIRYGEVDEQATEALKRHRGVVHLIENGALAGRVVRFSKTLCTVGAGLLLMPLFSDFFILLGLESVPNRLVVILLSLAFAVSVHFVFAEIFPRGLAMRDPSRALRWSYRVLLFFQVLTYPLLLVFRAIKRVLFRALGVDVEDEFNPLDLDVQIRAMGEDGGDFSEVVRKIMNRAMQMHDLVVHDVLLPRREVVICNLEEDIKTNLARMKEAGHTRFPLCRADLDDCVGIIHIKDIFRWREPVSQIDLMKLKRNVAVFSLETPLEEALERMLRAKFHMALAVDEFGGVVGVITLESILEELVGEIQDEFDSEEEQIIRLPQSRSFRISGLAPIHAVEEALDVQIKNEEVSTFGGFITGEMGRIPVHGEQFRIDNLDITVTEVDERRVIAARVQVHPKSEAI